MIWTYIFKLFLNSVYGKFAQQELNTIYLVDPELCTIPMYNDIEGQQPEGGEILTNIVDKGDMLEVEVNQGHKIHIGRMVRFSAYITAKARTKLAKAVRTVGKKHVKYMDTDSMYLTEEGAEIF